MDVSHHIAAVDGMPVLSLHQPWATALVRGIKRFETRSWPMPQAIVGRVVGIHATSKKPDQALVAANGRRLSGPLPTGALVGRVRFDGCHQVTGPPERRNEAPGRTIYEVVPTRYVGSEETWHLSHEAPWSDQSVGRYIWTVRDRWTLDHPLPARGRQRIWRWRSSPHTPASWIRAYRVLIALARKTVCSASSRGGRELAHPLASGREPRGACLWCRESTSSRRTWHDTCLVTYLIARGRTVDMNGRPFVPLTPCENCGAEGDREIDHRLALSVARSTRDPITIARAWSIGNLRWLCHKCHAMKTGRDRRALTAIRRQSRQPDLFGAAGILV